MQRNRDARGCWEQRSDWCASKKPICIANTENSLDHVKGWQSVYKDCKNAELKKSLNLFHKYTKSIYNYEGFTSLMYISHHSWYTILGMSKVARAIFAPLNIRSPGYTMDTSGSFIITVFFKISFWEWAKTPWTTGKLFIALWLTLVQKQKVMW